MAILKTQQPDKCALAKKRKEKRRAKEQENVYVAESRDDENNLCGSGMSVDVGRVNNGMFTGVVPYWQNHLVRSFMRLKVNAHCECLVDRAASVRQWIDNAESLKEKPHILEISEE
uniref:DDE-1 domain-containing protein n=1 Tax=Ascaris lumbricoides TaxID=6252 RepID=A0A0M3ICH5_ASCLU